MNKPHIGVILAAGKGTRMDRTDTPKPLVKVGSKSLIIWNIEQLEEVGVSKVYIIVGHRGEEIKKELTNNPSITIDLEFIHQSDDTKAGIVKSILSLVETLKEPFFLTMSDLVIEKNPYSIFLENEIQNSHVLTLVDTRKSVYKQSGALSRVHLSPGKLDHMGRTITDWNGLEIGVYLFNQVTPTLLHATLKEMPENPTIDDLFLKFLNDKKLNPVILSEGEWFDVNTPATLIRANIFSRKSYKGSLKNVRAKKLKSVSYFSRFKREKKMETEIVIEEGIADKLSEFRIIPEASLNSIHYLLTDSVVDALYGEKILQELSQGGYDVRKLVVPSGEKSKSTSEFERLADEIFSQGLDKYSFILSLGGGVVNNIAGFLSSTLYRGIGLIHIPTTMMAQVDAAIDFKQAINSPKGKNLIGSYYPALSVIMDPNLLLTLNDRHLSNGISESIKHGLTQDPEFIEFLLKHKGKLREVSFLAEIVRKTVELKVPLLNGKVEKDMNEMLPQYGHSVGHAIEHLSSYELLHGEAIAIGMCVSAEIANILGICDSKTLERHYEIFEAYNLPTIVPQDITDEDIINTIHYDKHHVGNPHMALVKKIGKMFHEKNTYGIPIEYEILKRGILKNKKRYKK